MAGHAGLFGTAAGVAAFARLVLRAARGRSVPAPLSPSLVAAFTAKSTVAGSSRALGWDTMLPTSSCGTRMSPAAIGHVGFTGTSLWIDPIRDRYFVLLTNRSCRGGTLADMRTVRRSFHDALGELWTLMVPSKSDERADSHDPMTKFGVSFVLTTGAAAGRLKRIERLVRLVRVVRTDTAWRRALPSAAGRLRRASARAAALSATVAAPLSGCSRAASRPGAAARATGMNCHSL